MNRADMLRFVSGASDTELVDMIFMDPISGIPNRNAYNLRSAESVAIIDMDSLKWINDNMGHVAGDQQLRILGRVLLRAFGNDAYHLSGDEFAVVGKRGELLRDRLEGLQHNMNFFSFGVGPDLNIADKNMQLDKAIRENAGTRAPRGEAPPTYVKSAKQN
jgi:GGDEF domain-containing protein